MTIATVVCPHCAGEVGLPMTVTEAAEIIGCHRHTIIRWLNNGQLKLVGVDPFTWTGRYLVDAADVRRLAEERRLARAGRMRDSSSTAASD